MPRRPPLCASDLAHQRAFVRSIQETPDDDVPRLVYADWLDDHGDAERADLIRTQCRLEATPRGTKPWRELKAREAELLKRHKSEWLGPWDSRSNEATFRRGFLDTLRVGANFGVGLSSLVPALSPYHDLTRSFAFEANKLAEGLVPVLGEALPCLRRLECEKCYNGNALIEAIAGWAESSLTDLVLRRCTVSSAGLARLYQWEALASLRSLDLRDNLFSHDALTSLLLRPELRALEGLAITGSQEFTGHALVPLLANHLSGLRRLRVQGAGLRSAGVEMLAAAPALARFVSLELLACGIMSDGATALAASDHVSRLTTLNLRHNRICDAGYAALADAPRLAALTSLDLYGMDVVGFTNATPAGGLALVRSPHLRNLETLRLSCSGSTGAVAEALLDPRNLPRLRDLVLNVGRTDEMVERLRARGVELTTIYGGD